MAALSSKLRSLEGGRIAFRCPGCGDVHAVTVREDGVHVSPAWGWNHDPVRPTFTPSIRVTGHKIIRDAAGLWTGEWERDAAGRPLPSVCHSFVTDGRIQFLGDCTHALAGQTVDLPDWEG